MKSYDFVLASASPRRREILNNVGINHKVIVSNADESNVLTVGVPINLYVEELALLKTSSVAKTLDKIQNTLVIGADTIVYHNEKILGKPKSEEDAFNILKSLSGDTHEVYTGFCIMRVNDGYSVCEYEKTEVTFRKLTDSEILDYIKSGEPMDKAGSYGIQGMGSMFISKINGDYFNVVGLPICKLVSTLKEQFDYKVFN